MALYLRFSYAVSHIQAQIITKTCVCVSCLLPDYEHLMVRYRPCVADLANG